MNAISKPRPGVAKASKASKPGVVGGLESIRDSLRNGCAPERQETGATWHRTVLESASVAELVTLSRLFFSSINLYGQSDDAISALSDHDDEICKLIVARPAASAQEAALKATYLGGRIQRDNLSDELEELAVKSVVDDTTALAAGTMSDVRLSPAILARRAWEIEEPLGEVCGAVGRLQQYKNSLASQTAQCMEELLLRLPARSVEDIVAQLIILVNRFRLAGDADPAETRDLVEACGTILERCTIDLARMSGADALALGAAGVLMPAALQAGGFPLPDYDDGGAV